MIGARPFHWIAIPTVLLLFLSDGILKGFNGYVNHAELGVLYGAMVLALFPSADRFSINTNHSERKQSHNFAIPVFLAAFTLCLAYSFVGIHRFLYGGIDQFMNNALFTFLTVNSFNYSKFSFTFGLIIAESEHLLVLFNGGFFLVTLLEILSPFVFIYTYFRFVWLIVIIPFHILSLFTMNIFFWENLILIMILFIYIAKKNPQTN